MASTVWVVRAAGVDEDVRWRNHSERTLGGNNWLVEKGTQDDSQGLKGTWCCGRKIAGDGCKMIGEVAFRGVFSEPRRPGAGLFLISRFLHLARRFWNQTWQKIEQEKAKVNTWPILMTTFYSPESLFSYLREKLKRKRKKLFGFEALR